MIRRRTRRRAGFTARSPDPASGRVDVVRVTCRWEGTARGCGPAAGQNEFLRPAGCLQLSYARCGVRARWWVPPSATPQQTRFPEPAAAGLRPGPSRFRYSAPPEERTGSRGTLRWMETRAAEARVPRRDRDHLPPGRTPPVSRPATPPGSGGRVPTRRKSAAIPVGRPTIRAEATPGLSVG